MDAHKSSATVATKAHMTVVTFQSINDDDDNYSESLNNNLQEDDAVCFSDRDNDATKIIHA